MIRTAAVSKESENLTSRFKSEIQVSLLRILREAVKELLYSSRSEEYCKPFLTMIGLILLLFFCFIFFPKSMPGLGSDAWLCQEGIKVMIFGVIQAICRFKHTIFA